MSRALASCCLEAIKVSEIISPSTTIGICKSIAKEYSGLEEKASALMSQYLNELLSDIPHYDNELKDYVEKLKQYPEECENVKAICEKIVRNCNDFKFLSDFGKYIFDNIDHDLGLEAYKLCLRFEKNETFSMWEGNYNYTNSLFGHYFRCDEGRKFSKITNSVDNLDYREDVVEKISRDDFLKAVKLDFTFS
jgi:hypothetical protein